MKWQKKQTSGLKINQTLILAKSAIYENRKNTKITKSMQVNQILCADCISAKATFGFIKRNIAKNVTFCNFLL